MLCFEGKQESIVSKITQQSITSSGWHVSYNIYSLQRDTLAGVNAASDVVLMWAAPWGLSLTYGKLQWKTDNTLVCWRKTQNDRLTRLWSVWHKDHYQLRSRWRKNWGQKGTCLVLSQICAIPVETDDPLKTKITENSVNPTGKEKCPERRALTLLYLCNGLTSLGRKHNYGYLLMY